MYKVLILLFLMSFVFAAEETKLIEFKLEDQHERKFTEADFRGYISVFIASDRGGSAFNELWASAIVDSLRDYTNFGDLKVEGVAHLGSVPFFLRGFVKGFFDKSDKQKSILLDWKGIFNKTYSLIEDDTNILIFNRDGIKLLHESGRELEPTKLQNVLEILRTELDKDN
ncbi:MAG: hypothetical protein H6696_00870 [Deferribacteres bacterium]|nr:hypothetical protein [Deferribacteres bacterium]